jgi:hypothetical protein
MFLINDAFADGSVRNTGVARKQYAAEWAQRRWYISVPFSFYFGPAGLSEDRPNIFIDASAALLYYIFT